MHLYLIVSGILVSVVGLLVNIELSVFMAFTTAIYAVLAYKYQAEHKQVVKKPLDTFKIELSYLRHRYVIGDLTPVQYHEELENLLERYNI